MGHKLILSAPMGVEGLATTRKIMPETLGLQENLDRKRCAHT